MQAAAGPRPDQTNEIETARHRRRLATGLIFCFWTLIGLLYAGQYYFGFSDGEDDISWWRLVAWQLSTGYVWVALTPLILWLGKRFPIERSSWIGRLLLHLAVSAIVSATYIAAYTAITRFADVFPDWKINTLKDQYIHFLWMYFHLHVFTYFAILGAGLAFDYYHKYRERERQAAELRTQLAHAQLQVLRAQLHPHFLFNTLNTIAGLVRNNENKAAVDMLAGLSDLLRHALETSSHQEVALRDELEFIERYLAIQRMRFSDRLSVKTEIDPDTLDAIVPNLILQPLVENAIRHGLAARAAPGLLSLTAHRSNGELQIRIYNDGPTLAEGWRMENSAGIGLQNTRDRLEQLYGAQHQLEVRNQGTSGVVAWFSIPFRVKFQDGQGEEKNQNGNH
jgi:two-component system, LytTR family, sensor kinase